MEVFYVFSEHFGTAITMTENWNYVMVQFVQTFLQEDPKRTQNVFFHAYKNQVSSVIRLSVLSTQTL